MEGLEYLEGGVGVGVPDLLRLRPYLFRARWAWAARRLCRGILVSCRGILARRTVPGKHGVPNFVIVIISFGSFCFFHYLFKFYTTLCCIIANKRRRNELAMIKIFISAFPKVAFIN